MKLSDGNSVFQLAFGLNAVIPILVASFDDVKEKTAESLLRKIREHQPKFALKENERVDFTEFHFGSNKGLQYARIITRVVICASLIFCGISLGALVWAAVDPEHEIQTSMFYLF